MKFLILINSAPDYQPFFREIGDRLLAAGQEVVYATESRLGDYEYREHKIETPYVFSDYLIQNPETPELPAAYLDSNVWETMFSDFDRFENFNVNRSRRTDWYVRIVNSLYCFFEKIRQENEIDLVIYENVSNSFSYVAYEVFKRANVPYLGWATSRMPGRYESHTSVYKDLRNEMFSVYQQLIEGQIATDESRDQWVVHYYDNFMHVPPDYMLTNGLNLQNPVSKYANSGKLKRIYRRLQFVLAQPADAYPYHFGNPLVFSFNQFKRNLYRYVKSGLIESMFQEPDFTIPYFLYPLHFHPESSTSVWARHYVDEYTVIKNVSFNLPAGHKLYVKDHKSAVGYPSMDFYRNISAIPNVKMIQPNAPTKKLIQNSKGVITLTGTVGYEALILGKSVVVLGNVFYDFHPRCFKMIRWDELFNILNTICCETTESSKAECMNLIAAYYVNTKPGRLLIGGENSEELKDKLAKEAIEMASLGKVKSTIL